MTLRLLRAEQARHHARRGHYTDDGGRYDMPTGGALPAGVEGFDPHSPAGMPMPGTVPS